MMKKRCGRLFAVMLAVIMVFSVMPQLTQDTSSAAEKTKLTIISGGKTYTITESEWSKLYEEKAETHMYSSREKSYGEYDGSSCDEYTGVKLADVFESVGIDTDSMPAGKNITFKATDGCMRTLTAGRLLQTKFYAYGNSADETAGESSAAEPQEVPVIISDADGGRLIMGQESASDFNKTNWVKYLFGGTITLEPSGTADDPYLISTADELFAFAKNINAGKNASKCYRLTGDIDLGGKAWTPVGLMVKPFKGVFDGGGYSISGLNVEDNGSFLGLFGYSIGTIKNLSVSGYVTNTSTSDTSEAGNEDFIGGVAGFNAGTIEDVDSNVVVDAAGANNVGGIAGFNTSGKWVDARGTEDEEKTIEGAAGIIARCSNAGFVAGRMKVGGLVGENAGTVSECFNKGTIANMKTYGGSGVGGIAGRNGNNDIAYETGIITNCYNAGTVVLDCYNTGKEKNQDGSVKLTGKWGGGICGFANDLSSIENSYVCGKLDVEFAYGDWAPLYPRGDGGEAVTECYTIEGMPVCDKSQGNEKRIGTIKTKEYMQSENFVSDLGGSFAADTANLNGGFPVLHWQTAERTLSATQPKVETGKVSSFKVKSYGTSSLALTWSGVSDADGYKIEKYTSGGYKTIATLKGADSTSYTAKGLASGSGYKFRVRAYRVKYDIASYGSYSSTLSAPVKPGKVTLSKLTTGKSHYVKAYWKKKTGTGYQAVLSTNSKFKSGVKTYKVTSYKTLSKKITKLKKGKKYYVKVRAYKTYGDKTVYGSYSSVKKIKCR